MNVFAIVPVEAALDLRLTAREYRVLIALLSFRNKDTQLAFPTREQIGERCHMAPTRVSATTSSLERKGWLAKQGKGGYGRATTYRIMVPENSYQLGNGYQSGNGYQIPDTQPSPPGGTPTVTPGGDTNRPLTDHGTDHRPGEEDREPTPKPKRATVTIRTFIDACKAKGEAPIPHDDPIFDYARDAGIPEDFLHLAWREFVERNTGTKKRYASWRQAFHNAVRSNWYRLWYFDEGKRIALTTAGEQARRKHASARAAA